jgi:predicted nucleotide-binding protein/DNA-binding MarR family transcriptional regulator
MLKKFEQASINEEEQRKQRVFVVHGRNEELRKSMFDFLRSIGLKPIEWGQAIQMTGETAPFIGDILDAAFLHAQAVVVLLSGDDEARLRSEYYSEKMPEYEKNLTPQSRPNVLFEAGLAMGRFPKQTIIVEVGDLRPFSDIAGRHTVRLNNSTKARQDVAQRLIVAGCKVDLSGTDWHTTGDFTSQQPRSKNLNNQEANKINTSGNSQNVQMVSDLEPNMENKVDLEQISKLVNLHPDQLRVMITIANSNSVDVVPEEVSKKSKIALQTVLYLLERLEKGGFVKNHYTSSIGRNHDKYKLTENGWNLLLSNRLK